MFLDSVIYLSKRGYRHHFYFLSFFTGQRGLYLSTSTKALDMSIDRDTAEAVIQRFPPSKWIFAYGSSVFPQITTAPTKDSPPINTTNPPKKNKLLDMIVVVDYPPEWHHHNMQINPNDYSFLAKTYPHVSHWIGEACAGMYFNADLPLIPHNDPLMTGTLHLDASVAGDDMRLKRIKYGVISVHNFIVDCTEWKWMYLAGRLHKPVYSLYPIMGANRYPPELAPSIHMNQKNALIYSLLRLHRLHSARLLSLQLVDILRQVVGLSYLNDVRFTFKSEDPLKVEKIVYGSQKWLTEMYLPLLAEIGVVQLTGDKSKVDKDTVFVSNEDTLMTHLSKDKLCNIKQQEMSPDKYLIELGGRQWWASAGEAMKGLWSTGPWTSIQYVRAKMGKALGTR